MNRSRFSACGALWDEHRINAKSKDPGHRHSSEIDLSPVLVQQHYVIDFGDGADLLPVLITWFVLLIVPSCSGFTMSQFSGIIS
jgi:hypothetical protein